MAGPRRTIDSYFRPKSTASVASRKGKSSSASSSTAAPSSSVSVSPTSTTAASATPSSRQDKTRPSSIHPYSQEYAPRREQAQKIHTISSPKATHNNSSSASSSSPPPLPNPFNLDRFLAAQSNRPSYLGSYTNALSQLRRGRKTSHWVWYIFPQMPLARGPSGGGGGRGGAISQMSRYYGIRSLGEARAYLAHDVLGARLREVTRVVLESPVGDVEVLMGGETDAAKLLSCMTLFARAAGAAGGDGVGEGDALEASVPAEEEEKKKKNKNKKMMIFQDVIDKYFDGEGDEVTEWALDEEAELD